MRRFFTTAAVFLSAFDLEREMRQAPDSFHDGHSFGAASPISIRRATREDATAFAVLAERIFVETFGPENTEADMREYIAKSFGPDKQLADIVDPAKTILLALSGATPIAFAQLRIGPIEPCITGPAPLEIQRFYVDSPFHGRGVAQALMRAVESFARSRDRHTLWLGVWERNARAIAFYEKLGFTTVGRTTFILGSDTQHDYVMSKPLVG